METFETDAPDPSEAEMSAEPPPPWDDYDVQSVAEVIAIIGFMRRQAEEMLDKLAYVRAYEEFKNDPARSEIKTMSEEANIGIGVFTSKWTSKWNEFTSKWQGGGQ